MRFRVSTLPMQGQWVKELAQNQSWLAPVVRLTLPGRQFSSLTCRFWREEPLLGGRPKSFRLKKIGLQLTRSQIVGLASKPKPCEGFNLQLIYFLLAAARVGAAHQAAHGGRQRQCGVLKRRATEWTDCDAPLIVIQGHAILAAGKINPPVLSIARRQLWALNNAG